MYIHKCVSANLCKCNMYELLCAFVCMCLCAFVCVSVCACVCLCVHACVWMYEIEWGRQLFTWVGGRSGKWIFRVEEPFVWTDNKSFFDLEAFKEVLPKNFQFSFQRVSFWSFIMEIRYQFFFVILSCNNQVLDRFVWHYQVFVRLNKQDRKYKEILGNILEQAVMYSCFFSYFENIIKNVNNSSSICQKYKHGTDLFFAKLVKLKCQLLPFTFLLRWRRKKLTLTNSWLDWQKVKAGNASDSLAFQKSMAKFWI